MVKTKNDEARSWRLAALVAALALAACGPGAPPAPGPVTPSAPAGEPASPPAGEPAAPPVTPPAATAALPGAAPAAEGVGTTIAFLGDSLTAGYGLEPEQAFPALIDQALRAEGRRVTVVNAGISGDTTAGGLSRVDWLLRSRPDILVVSLGANDGLRGLPLASSEKNLRAILEKAKAAGARVLLVGMMIPPNYGPDYTRQFSEIFPRLAAEQGVPLVPFLLEGVAGDRLLNQADGIHPTAEGHQILARTLLGPVRSLLDEAEKAQQR